MKNIMKGSVLVVVLTVLSLTKGYSQFSVGFDLGIPMGDFGTGSNVGLGGSIRYDGAIQDKLSWTGTFGYQSYGLKSSTGASGHTSIMPLMGGIKYYIQENNNGIYTGADIGLNFVSVSVDVSGFGSATASETRFGFSPVFGYRTGNFDVAARYNVISDFNNIGFRIAYVFAKK